MEEDEKGVSLAYLELGTEPGSPKYSVQHPSRDGYAGLRGTLCWPADF